MGSLVEAWRNNKSIIISIIILFFCISLALPGSRRFRCKQDLEYMIDVSLFSVTSNLVFQN
jgi:hypothetical protein